MDTTLLREPTAASVAAPAWVRFPNIYEINTWIWLSELSRKHGARVDLSSVPAAEWDAIARYGFDAVWLMGVWERSPWALRSRIAMWPCWRISGTLFQIFKQKTMWVPLTAYDATSWTRVSAGLVGWLLPGASS